MKTHEAVLALLQKDPTLAVPELARLLDRAGVTILRAVRKLRESGRLARVGPPRAAPAPETRAKRRGSDRENDRDKDRDNAPEGGPENAPKKVMTGLHRIYRRRRGPRLAQSVGCTVLHGPDPSAGEPGAERSDPDYRDVLLEWRLRDALVHLSGYPPDKEEKATQTVLEQAQVLSEEWVSSDR